ncbi:Uncharacterised protein [Halioglobus japonicus]|nr:Uncharacterised protein [Halioglobus japonicus]
MKNLTAIFLIVFSCLSYGAASEDPLARASAAYLKEGVEAFIPSLLEGSPLEGEKSILTQANSIRQIEAYYGAYEGYEVIFEKALTSRVRLVYYVMNYEKSPVFGVSTYYKMNDQEVVTNFNFHTEIGQIVPDDVLYD